MGLWDDLKIVGSDLLSKGSEFAKEAGQKAQDAADMAKIKLDIAAREKEIKDLYTKIGKAYYEANKEDAEEYAEEIGQINDKFAVIAELKSKYAMYKDAQSGTKSDTAADDVAELEEDSIEVIFEETAGDSKELED